MYKKFLKVQAFIVCAVLMMIFTTTHKSQAQSTLGKNSRKAQMEKASVPNNYEGWINIGVFDSITGATKSTVTLTDTAGNAIRNINEIKQGHSYILRNSNNGLWVLPPGMQDPNRKGYLEVKTILDANSIIKITSDIYVSKIKYYPNWHWVRVQVVKSKTI